MRILLLGKKRSGKSSLLSALFPPGHCGGIITPAVFENGVYVGKDAVNLLTGERRPFCRIKERAPFEGVATRKYIVSREGIAFCMRALEQARCEPLIIIDEVGPLELSGEGIHEEVHTVLKDETHHVLLVVREELEEEFLRAFPYVFRKLYLHGGA